MTYDFYYDSIPVGRENAITRAELADKWGMSQDQVRHTIADLRARDNGDNFIIFSSSDKRNRGYYKTDNAMERRAFVNETRSRAINTFKPLKKAQRIEKGEQAQQYTFGNNLKTRRIAAGISNVEMVGALSAAGMYIDAPLLSRIENGYVLPTPAMAEEMASMLNCEVQDIFDFAYLGGVI